MILKIINFIKNLLGLNKPVETKEKFLKEQIKKTEKKLEEIENEKISDNDIVDHFNTK